MSLNEIDIYWVRARLRESVSQAVKEKMQKPYDLAYSGFLDGVDLALQCLSDVVGIDYTAYDRLPKLNSSKK